MSESVSHDIGKGVWQTIRSIPRSKIPASPGQAIEGVNRMLDTAIAGRVIGVRESDITKTHNTPEGGRVTFALKQDLIACTIGHILAIPTTHLTMLTFNSIFKNPSEDLVNNLYERWKDVPWKGDVLVRVGHSSIRGDIERLFLLNRDWIKGRGTTFKMLWAGVARTAFLPLALIPTVMGKVLRADHYNPYTQTVNVFHPRQALGMHEIGHAQFFDERHPLKGASYLLGRIVPFVPSFTEWKATANAMKRFKNDKERRDAMKILEGAWGTYFLSDVVNAATPFIPRELTAFLAQPLIKVAIGSLRLGILPIKIASGALSGHILSRLPYPGKRERFGYVFEGKKAVGEGALDDRQVRYASARAPVT